MEDKKQWPTAESRVRNGLIKPISPRIVTLCENPRLDRFFINQLLNSPAADPERRPVKWNHSFELTRQSAIGGVLLLHGMSDSPYTMRALGETLNQQGYLVVVLRLPGHGTVPSGLRYVSWQDMVAPYGCLFRGSNTSPTGGESEPASPSHSSTRICM